MSLGQRVDRKTIFSVSYLWNNGVDLLTRKNENVKTPFEI